MSFQDIIKKSVLSSFSNSNITTAAVCVTLGFALLISLYIFVVYYLSMRKTFYNKTFNISLVATSVITAGIILSMQSNLAISLGMVGALSIVRFRTAIKDPKDLVFMFWAISTGIVCGAGIFEIAIISSLVVTIAIFALELTPVGCASSILVINADSLDREGNILETVKKNAKASAVKSRNASITGADFVVECRTKDGAALLKAVMELEGVSNASLLAHDGEVHF